MSDTDITTAEAVARLLEDATPFLVAMIPLLAKVLRRRSIHWSLWPGITKAIGFVIEVLDFVHLPKITPSDYDLRRAEEQARRIANRRRARRISDAVRRARNTGEYTKVGD